VALPHLIPGRLQRSVGPCAETDARGDPSARSLLTDPELHMVNLAQISPSRTRDDCPEARAAAIAHVLVCLDRSASSDACLPHARFVAEAFGARLTLLHVMPSPPSAHERSRVDALEWEIARREAELYLDRARASLGAAPDTTITRMTQGSPAEQIVAAAREMAADVTVLASHGEGGREAVGAGLGSVAQHVLATASGSVLLVQPACSARTPPHRIMVPLDGSVRSECVLPIVADLAHTDGAEVLLVHVVTEPIPTAVLSEPDDIQLALALASRMEANAESYLARIRARMLPRVSSVRSLVVRRGEERQALLDIASERVFGSVASYLLSHASIPLFVLQDMPRRALERSPSSSPRENPGTRSREGE
jgi:nucleotide-binding universal stress UspA family protein